MVWDFALSPDRRLNATLFNDTLEGPVWNTFASLKGGLNPEALLKLIEVFEMTSALRADVGARETTAVS